MCDCEACTFNRVMEALGVVATPARCKNEFFGGRVVYYEGEPPESQHYDVESPYPAELTNKKRE